MSPILYHGTSTGHLHQILANGLDPNSSYKRYLCYSDEFGCAAWFAHCMSESDSSDLGEECQPIVFKIDTDRFDPKLFCLEQNFIELGPTHCRGVANWPIIRAGRYWLWQDLYRLSGAVGYKGLLKVTQADIISDVPVPEGF